MQLRNAARESLSLTVYRYTFAASKAVFTGVYDKNRRHGQGSMAYVPPPPPPSPLTLQNCAPSPV
jgi:hypothetical protein